MQEASRAGSRPASPWKVGGRARKLHTAAGIRGLDICAEIRNGVEPVEKPLLPSRGSSQGEDLIAMSKGGAKRIRVGIIGANPDRGWAAQAHIPALTSLSEDFEITALSTSRPESADAASKLFGVPVAFDHHQDLVNSPAVDVVAVTVKVLYHLELASAALEAGKAVYCEWPLANGLKEAETLAALAKKQGVLAVAGMQARSAPSVAYVRDLIEQGYVGEVLSTTLIGSGMGWGPTVEPFNAYLNDKKNGATMLSIALGHAADALCHCLGEVRELSATMTVRRTTFTIAETGESRPMTADDQVSVSGLLEGGAAFSIHYRGGRSRGTNLLWEINGSEGDLQLTSAGGLQASVAVVKPQTPPTDEVRAPDALDVPLSLRLADASRSEEHTS